MNRTNAMIHFIFLFQFCLFRYSFGTRTLLGLSQRSELQTSDVCSTKRSACLYIAGRYPNDNERKSEQKIKKRTKKKLSANGYVWNDPANERRGKFLRFWYPPPLDLTVRPTDKHTNTQTQTHTHMRERERRTASSSSLRMQRRKERVRYYLLEGVYSVYSLTFSPPSPNNLPAWYRTQKQLRRQEYYIIICIISSLVNCYNIMAGVVAVICVWNSNMTDKNVRFSHTNILVSYKKDGWGLWK
jgi:hypothetical protein